MADATGAAPARGSGTAAHPQPARRRLWVIATLGALTATAVLGLLRLVNPVADEWQCVPGEAPAVTAEGGRACFPEGSTLPASHTWDPLGNRPLPASCGTRGWAPVIGPSGERDCARADAPLPPGYRRA